MGYSVERLKKHPAVLVTFHKDFKVPEDAIGYAHDTQAILDNETKPIAVIVDFKDYALSLNDLLAGTKLGFTPEANVTNHPNTARLIVVTQAALLKLSVDGFRKMGLVKEIHVVDSLDQAWALV